MEIFFSIVAVLSLVFCALMIIDKTLFSRKLKSIETGMTGEDIRKATGLKLQVIEIRRGAYTARVHSGLTIFKCKLFFRDGRFVNLEKE